jgi:hypothetical protein
VLDPGTSPAGSDGTEVLYGPQAHPKAQVVAGYFPSGLSLREVSASILGDADVAVVVGDDFSEVPEV